MELLVADVAQTYGRTTRLVQQSLRFRTLRGHRRIGRTITVEDVAAAAWSRSLGRGRRWTPGVYQAAMDLLTNGTTERLSSSERSRLRSRLRKMSASDIAHVSGGLERWGRYRCRTTDNLTRIGPSAVDSRALHIVTGEGWLTFVQVPDLFQFELEHEAVLDADGNVGVIERTQVDSRLPRILLDTYLLGDARQSHAAAMKLEEIAHAL